jgi:predicted metal-dependent enzyme (double-stranded beta helix superfamily)
MGKLEEARRLLSDFSSQLEQFPDRAYMLASVHFTLGEYDQGFEWLERAYQERSPGMRLLKVDPLYDCVRADPRFTAMLKKMGLE